MNQPSEQKADRDSKNVKTHNNKFNKKPKRILLLTRRINPFPRDNPRQDQGNCRSQIISAQYADHQTDGCKHNCHDEVGMHRIKVQYFAI